MRRREFIVLVGVAAIARSRPVGAQPAVMPVIGFLHSGSSDPWSSFETAFRRGLAEAGYIDGQQLAIVQRWAENRFDRLPGLAGELVRSNVSLIFVGGGDVAAHAAKSTTSTIPIVFAIGADPVKQGIVASFNRPGGNVTGVSFLSVELRPKLLELIQELLPNAATIALLANPSRPAFEQLVGEVLVPARAMGLQVHVLKAGNEREIDAAFATLHRVRVDAILALSDPVYLNLREQLARLAMSHRLPSVHSSRENVIAGGLASYGANIEDAYRQAGLYAGRILKGEKPADLPVMQPTTFHLAINLRTANALGLKVAPTLLARADEVIE
jgi:putative ABC transport system substrate-binding protein